MKLSTGEFWGVWGVILAVHVGMFVPYRKKWQAYQDKMASRIRRFNALRGYGQEVGREELAEAYTTPFKTDALSSFAEMNGMTVDSYRKELREGVGVRVLPLFAVFIQAAAMILGLSGLAYLVTSIPVSREVYVFGLGMLLVVEWILYPYV